MPFVVLWSDIGPASYREVRACGIFDSIFVLATKGQAQTQVYPISPGRTFFRVIDSLRDVCLGVRNYRFSWHLLSINARHATCFVEHSQASFRRAMHSLAIALLMVRR
jgi:hypothetical protein